MDNYEFNYDDVVLFWHSTPRHDVLQLDQLLGSFKIMFAYNSIQFRNEFVTLHDTRNIFQSGKVSDFTGKVYDLIEIENLRKCHEMLINKVVADVPLSIELINKTHSVLTCGLYDGSDVMSQSAEEKLQTVLEKIEKVQYTSNFDGLQTAAYFISEFSAIRPFAHENGKTARSMMNYYLIVNDYPPITLHYANKDEFFAALEKYKNGEGLAEMTKLLKQECIQSWSSTISSSNNPFNYKKDLDYKFKY